MNKRFEELYKEAHIPDTAIDPSNNMPYPIKSFSAEKFAELIIQECIDIISPYALRMENFDGGHPITDIRKNFGVE